MHVFVVEDYALLRRGIVSRLKAIEQIEIVGEAEKETEALSKIRSAPPDLVLLDLSLADGGSGFCVLRELGLTGFGGKVVIVSSEHAAAKVCMQAGADGFYDKASGLELLFEDLADFVNLQQRVDSPVAWPHRQALGGS